MDNRWGRRVTMKDALADIGSFPCRDQRNGTTCNDRGQEDACESCIARRATSPPLETRGSEGSKR